MAIEIPRVWMTAILAVTCLASAGLAQTPKKAAPAAPKAAEKAPAKVDPKAKAEAVNELPAPSPLTKHLLVDVHLKNGAAFRGVAMNGRTIELAQGPDYVEGKESDRSAVGAGIRLWFYRSLDGFTFLAYAFIDHVEVKQQLRESEMEEIRAKVRENVQAIANGGKPDAAGAAKTDSKAGWSALNEEQRKLLEKYPPTAGWSIARYETVQRQFVNDNVQPTPEEDAWILVYPDWVKAYRAFEGIPDAPVAAAKGAKAPAGTPAPKAQAPAPKIAPSSTNAKKTTSSATPAPTETAPKKELQKKSGTLQEALSTKGGSSGDGAGAGESQGRGRKVD